MAITQRQAPLESERSFVDGSDVVLRLGALLLQSGASTARTAKVMHEILARLGLAHSAVVLTPDFMMVCAEDEPTPPVVRATPQIGFNLHRLLRLERLIAVIERSAIDPRALRAGLETIASVGPPYTRWKTITAYACVGGAFGQLMDADWAGSAIAALACATAQFVRSGLGGRFHVGVTTMITAFVSAFIGALGARLHLTTTVIPTLMGSVALLIPGLWLITGGQDVMSGTQLGFGLMRLAAAFLLFATIVAGVGLVVAVLS